MKGILVSASWAALILSTPAFAQQTAPADQRNDSEDIVVTATKMGQTALQSTPIAMSALTAEQLSNGGVRDIVDLKTYVPSLQVSDLSGYTQLYVRGVGSNIVFIGSDPSTTIHLDGVYLGRPLSYLNDFLDVERVEVLRGPQGTLYGRNSVGGTINIVSRKPSATPEATLVGQFGTYDRYGVKGYVSGPIGSGGIAASLAFDVSGHDAFRTNVGGGNDVEDAQSRGVRGQLLLPLGSAGELLLRGDWSRQSGAMAAYPKLLRPDGIPLDDSILGAPSKVSMDGDNRTVLENFGAAADLNLTLAPDIKLHSLTAWRGFAGSIDTDADSSSAPVLRNLVAPIRQRQFSQEFNLLGKTGPLQWVVGAYYFRETNSEPLTLTVFPFTLTHVQRSHLTAESAALFGQAEWHLTDKLSLVAGLRYTTENKHYRLDDYYTLSVDQDPAAAAAAPLYPASFAPSAPFTVDARRKEHAVTPKFGINFKPTDAILVYASATRGFKSGGFDYGSNNPVDAAAGYGPEKLWSYEAGVKSDWLDHHLRLNLTGFFYDYTDLQVQTFVQTGNGGFGAVTRNAATARIKGLEVETIVKPVSGLQLFANLAFLDAHYGRFPSAYVPAFGNFDASGKKLNNAPGFSATLGGSYSIDLASHGKIELGSDVHVQSRVFFTAANDGVGGVTAYPEQQSGYAVLNARLGWTSASGKWQLGVVGTNLTDRNYVTGTANYTLAISGRQGRPREVLGQVTRKF